MGSNSVRESSTTTRQQNDRALTRENETKHRSENVLKSLGDSSCFPGVLL
jgi:hypothetical protein